MNIAELQKKIIPEIAGLLKKEPESVSMLEETKDGWILQCEILEKKSIPETYDLLKVFEFKLDNNAKILGFKEVRKKLRKDT